MTVEERVSIRAHFDRFPATVKGAFVLRGEDPDPHQVALRDARVASLAGGSRSLGVAPAVFDVAPHRDVFVPFEFPVADLEPGWYGLECDLEIDGRPTTVPCGKRFAVAWPRATVRRGQVRVGKTVSAGGARVRIEQLECLSDSIKLHFAAAGEEAPPIRLSADDDRVPIVEESFDPGRGRGTLIAYPLLRAHEMLRIHLGRGRDAGVMEVHLP